MHGFGIKTWDVLSDLCFPDQRKWKDIRTGWRRRSIRTQTRGTEYSYLLPYNVTYSYLFGQSETCPMQAFSSGGATNRLQRSEVI